MPAVTDHPAAAQPRGPAPDPVRAEDPLDRCLAHIAGLPATHPRAIGLWLARGGAGVSLVALPVSIALLNIGLAMGIAGLLLALVPLHRLTGFIPGALMMGWMGLSLLVNHGHDPAPEYVGLGYIWLQLLVAQVAFRHRPTMRVALPLLVVTSAMVAALAVVQFRYGLDQSAGWLRLGAAGPRGAASGVYSLTLTLGHVMACLLMLLASPLAWSWPRAAPGVPGQLAARGRLVALGGAVAGAVGLLASASRSGAVGAAAGILATLFARGRRLLLSGAIAVGLVLVLGLLLSIATPGRFHAMLHGQDGRWPIWEVSVHLAWERPWFGWGGPNAFTEAYRVAFPTVLPGVVSEFPQGAPHAHCTPLAVAADYGAPAGLAFIALLTSPLWALRRRRASLPRAWRLVCGLTATAGVASLFEVLHSPSSHVTWLALGLALAWAAHERQAEPPDAGQLASDGPSVADPGPAAATTPGPAPAPR